MKKPIFKVYDLGHDLFLTLFTPVTLLKSQDYSNREVMSSCQELQNEPERRWALLWEGTIRDLGSNGMFCTLADSVSATWLWRTPDVL